MARAPGVAPPPAVLLTGPFRHPDPPELVRCDHPALEAEAVAAELAAAHDAGVPWSEMAVLVRHPRRRPRAISRALVRHGIPGALPETDLSDEPVVAAIVDTLRWAAGDEDAFAGLLRSPLSLVDADTVLSLVDELRARLDVDDPAGLAFLVWERAL